MLGVSGRQRARLASGPVAYDFATIEPKWQARWADERVFSTSSPTRIGPSSSTCRCIPYPSGEMHMGHLRNYTYVDLITRYKTMRGFNVLSPMGWDSFGLPAENAAIATGHPPPDLHRREDPDHEGPAASPRCGLRLGPGARLPHARVLRWDQWLFLQLFEQGLAYKKLAPVNWCPKDQTVLANEQVVDGACERCGTIVEKRDLEQWFFRITDYAERLLNDLALLDRWPERVRVMQENWIGRSEGAQFTIEGRRDRLCFEVFTTRPDTVFGMTFAVLAPEHPLVESADTGQRDRRRSPRIHRRGSDERARSSVSPKGPRPGVFTGAYAINPVNDRRVPIYIADYVLMGPTAPGRSWRFPARTSATGSSPSSTGIEIIRTVEPPPDLAGEAYTGEGPAINSDFLDGLDMASAKKRIIAWFEEQGIGFGKVQYRLRDWLISRQRYWGCPIPIIKCPNDGLVAVPESRPAGGPPRRRELCTPGRVAAGLGARIRQRRLPRCGGPAERETDTMDTFVDSSWYFLRYCDAHNSEKIFDPAKVAYWMPVDQYVGGVEHAVLHLLYARFITKVLHDMGLVEVEEPFSCAVHPGNDREGRRQDVEVQGQRGRPRCVLRPLRRRRHPPVRAIHRPADRRRNVERQRR